VLCHISTDSYNLGKILFINWEGYLVTILLVIATAIVSVLGISFILRRKIMNDMIEQIITVVRNEILIGQEYRESLSHTLKNIKRKLKRMTPRSKDSKSKK
jgi:hypothetical protein